MILALTLWLAASIITTGIVARLFAVSAQSDQQDREQIAQSDRAVLFAEMTSEFHSQGDKL